jgi:hypothetical protein
LFFVSSCKFDINITRNIDSLQFSIYKKPTTTDTIIPANSCHPPEQKYSAIRYLLNRLKCYPLEKTGKDKEISVAETIMHSYSVSLNFPPD